MGIEHINTQQSLQAGHWQCSEISSLDHVNI